MEIVGVVMAAAPIETSDIETLSVWQAGDAMIHLPEGRRNMQRRGRERNTADGCLPFIELCSLSCGSPSLLPFLSSASGHIAPRFLAHLIGIWLLLLLRLSSFACGSSSSSFVPTTLVQVVCSAVTRLSGEFC